MLDGHTMGIAQDLVLALYSGIIPGGIHGTI